MTRMEETPARITGTDAEAEAATLVEWIDARAGERVVVIGSLPPEGRDLDLLVRPATQAVLAELLAAEGFRERGGEWVRFSGCSVESLDLIAARDWGLPEPELEALFAEAIPIPGLSNLCRPSPHHVLLMLAQRVVEGDGRLADKRRARVDQALAEDPVAWQRAEARAPAWSSVGAVRALRTAHETGAPISVTTRVEANAERLVAQGWPRHRARARATRDVGRRRRRREVVISFSGLDGAGKSGQAEALRETLIRLGFDPTIEWTRLEWTTLWENRWLGVLSWPVRSGVEVVNWGLAKKAGLRRASAASAEPAPAAPPLEAAALRERSAVLSHVWVTIVALAHASAQRSSARPHLKGGRVVICDRYTLDSAAHLRYRYGPGRRFRFQTWLVDRLSPAPLCAFFLDVPAETAYARKAEQYDLAALTLQAQLYREEFRDLGVKRLDGERPREELCSEIAEDVWRALRSGP
jgi:thymidylate kinase